MDELTVEQRRCERLRNLLGNFYTLATFVDSGDNIPEKMLKKTAKNAMEVWPLIEKALDPNATLEELNQLYRDPENRRK